MIRKILVYSLLLLISCNVGASNVTMKTLFAEMPDSIITYLSRNNRLDMIDFLASNMKAEVTNSFDGKTEMLTITDNYLKLKLSDAVVMEMKLLDSAEQLSDTTNHIVCVVTTYGETPIESKIDFYTSKWNKVETIPNPIEGKGRELIVKSDSVSAEDYMSIEMHIDDMMVIANLSAEDNSLTLTPFLPLLNIDEKRTFRVCKKLIELKWDGNMFN